MNTLTAMITGIIIGKETQLHQIATNVPEHIKLNSTEKCNFSINYGFGAISLLNTSELIEKLLVYGSKIKKGLTIISEVHYRASRL